MSSRTKTKSKITEIVSINCTIKIRKRIACTCAGVVSVHLVELRVDGVDLSEQRDLVLAGCLLLLSQLLLAMPHLGQQGLAVGVLQGRQRGVLALTLYQGIRVSLRARPEIPADDRVTLRRTRHRGVARVYSSPLVLIFTLFSTEFTRLESSLLIMELELESNFEQNASPTLFWDKFSVLKIP